MIFQKIYFFYHNTLKKNIVIIIFIFNQEVIFLQMFLWK